MKNITFILFLLAGSGISIAQSTVSQKKTAEPAISTATNPNTSADSVKVILSTSKQQPVESMREVQNENSTPETKPEKITPVISTRKPE